MSRASLSGSTTLAAVIGSPVRHSLSPTIHNAAFVAMSLDWAYAAFEVPAGSGAEAVEAMRTLRLGGLSVTMPLKAEVAAAVDRLSPLAATLGAANCVAWEGAELVGHNTDGPGFVDALTHEVELNLQGSRVVVLGAGGAARAVIASLDSAGAEVSIWNRSSERAHQAADLGGPSCTAIAPESLETAVQNANVVVNATSVGMKGTSAALELPLEERLLHADHIVVDLVYHPRTTPLLAAASAAGATAVGGVGMLIHQAAHQLQLWTGQPAPLDAITDAVEATLSEG